MQQKKMIVNTPQMRGSETISYSEDIWAQLMPISHRLDSRVFDRIFGNRRRLLCCIGQEMVNAIKGGYKRMSGGERYTTGIRRQRSPDGQSHEPLLSFTLNKMRPWKEKMGIIPRARGANFILRETSQHILGGIRILSTTKNRVTVGIRDAKSREISELHNRPEGFDAKLGNFSVTVPSRPHWGISKALRGNMNLLFNRWIRHGIKYGKTSSFRG